MHMPVLHGIWFVLLYCLFIWGGFALALFLADSRKRLREACVGALLVLYCMPPVIIQAKTRATAM